MSDPAKPSRKRALSRSAARLAAVQALYQMDATRIGLDEVIAEFGKYRFGLRDGLGDRAEGEVPAEPDEAFFADLLRGVVRQQDEVDGLISGHLPEGWRLSRLDSTLLAILRAGTYELIARRDVPFKVVINEYVDITHAFFAGEEPGLVNGILDRLAHELGRAHGK
ncbi:transcription antitermination factor NusB [Dichotomicrobium thermohalophilum]|uniref:Transcription antitermination protein NusB n=1 Tax=Dichotomicrobium thermohalophilum TaxID=933063 RepID=A0A397Q474_9HYPH|nr:transcription antitermination factor NusB [Dichotomicrobium thermohalophilum]RIA55858.1 NusB antitermination factor [Dichotomicrobium thermohalophilum]